VETVRPCMCPGCGAGSRPIQGRVVVHGHGLRERQIRGVHAPFARPVLLTVPARRYACQRCGAILLVVPAAVAPRRLFDLATIAFALARWLGDGVASRAVRDEVSPLRIIGDSARRSWSQLRRWGRRAVEILRPPRPVPLDGAVASARLALDAVAARGPLSLARHPLAERVFAAMASAR
jgi:transposase